MAATAASFLHLVIFFDINVRSLALRLRVIAHDAAPSSRVPQPETDTWRTRNASHDGRQIRTGKRQG